ncbi:Vesicle transport protein [Macleaya cordata]|uniref:Vesicle transport protein n=1 Tax=Macleaya cordata TaxID=56857 RepID=A0A200QV93_MACCD|nr:Vesicle transport protein [Macleaya cordata]
MGFSKTEVNLRRLLATAPQQQNQAKLIHYVATLREQLEQLVAETTPDGLPRISKAKVNDYSEKIEALAAKLAGQPVRIHITQEIGVSETAFVCTEVGVTDSIFNGFQLYRSHTKVEDRSHEITENDPSAPIKLDAEAQAHIEKHRYSTLPKGQWSIAWQALVTQILEPWRYIPKLSRPHASLGC